jgi:putative drug exporter of the RND superfamily
VVLLAMLIVTRGKAVGGKTVDVYTIPCAQSQKAEDLLEERFPAQAGGTASVVFQARNGTITDATSQAAVAQTEANLAPGRAAHVTQPMMRPSCVNSAHEGRIIPTRPAP